MALDILAVIFGIFFTIRKLDAQSRKNSDFPHVAPSAFAVWQARETRVYGLGALACVLKLTIGLGFQYGVAPGLSASWIRGVGATIDLSWLVFVCWTFFRTHKLRKERAALGIVLGTPHRGPLSAPDEEER